jgi:hypothetical protein
MKVSVNKKEWIQALRSGDYQQCQGTLTDNKGFCCLGVWAKINGFEPYCSFASQSDPDDYMLLDGKRYNYSLFDELIGNVEWMDLANKNDEGVSFEEIAEIIEQKIEEKTITIN